jgi:hypothetical protein
MNEDNTPVEEIEEIQNQIAENENENEEGTPSEQSPAENVETQPTDADQKGHNEAGFWRRQAQKNEKELERIRQEMQQQHAQPVTAQPTQVQNIDPYAPKLENYEDPNQWFEDNMKYQVDKNKAVTAHQTKVNTYTQRLEEFSKTDPNIKDYDVAVSRMVAPAVADALLRSEYGPQLVKDIALDPKLAQKLNYLDSYDLARELVTLEENAKKAPSISNAPDPIKAPKGKTPQVSKTLDQTQSQDDYERMMFEYERNK